MTRLPGFLTEDQDIRHWATHHPLQESVPKSGVSVAAGKVPARTEPVVRRIRSSVQRPPLDRSKLPRYLRDNTRFRP